MGITWQTNVDDAEDVAPSAKFMSPNGKPYALNFWNNVHAMGAKPRKTREVAAAAAKHNTPSRSTRD